MIWFVVIAALVYIFVIRPFLKYRSDHNVASYLAVPKEVRTMIELEQVFELCELLVELELDHRYEEAQIILNAIDSKGFSFSKRVDKVRNELRIRAGMEPLKYF